MKLGLFKKVDKSEAKFLNDVKGGHEFKLHMGCDISNLKDMKEAIDIMAERTFEHHVNSKKNDFAIWIRESIGDKKLADEIGPVRNREKIANKLEKRVKYLEEMKSAGELDSKELLTSGVADFSIGAIVGLIVGIAIANLL